MKSLALVLGLVHQPVHQPQRRLTLAVVASGVPALGSCLLLVREVAPRGDLGEAQRCAARALAECDRGMKNIAWTFTAAIIIFAAQRYGPGSLCARRLIHPSAWKVNSPKSTCRILHNPSPTPLENHPSGTPHPRIPPGADLCLLRWMGILGSVDRGRRRDHRGGPVPPAPAGGGLCKSG
jgi:hypothetical protein